MIQETSLMSFCHIKTQLGNKQQQILEGFTTYGARTNLELSILMRIPINQITPRTNELVKKGMIRESCKRKCTISGRTAIAWEVVL